MISHFERVGYKHGVMRIEGGGVSCRNVSATDFIYFLVIRLFPVTARGDLIITTANGYNIYTITI